MARNISSAPDRHDMPEINILPQRWSVSAWSRDRLRINALHRSSVLFYATALILVVIMNGSFGSCREVGGGTSKDYDTPHQLQSSDYQPFGLSGVQLRGMLSMLPGLSPRCIERTVEGLQGNNRSTIHISGSLIPDEFIVCCRRIIIIIRMWEFPWSCRERIRSEHWLGTPTGYPGFCSLTGAAP